MSANPPLGGGSGSGDGSSDTNGSSSSGSTDVGPLRVTRDQAATIGALLAVAGTLIAIANRPIQFVASVIDEAIGIAFGESAQELLRDPIGFIIETVVVFIGSLVLEFMFAILNLILWFFLGADQEIGLGGGFPGVFDIPFFISVPVANAIYGVAFDIMANIASFNRNVAAQLEPLGIAAPAAANFLAVVQVGIAFWIAMIVVRSIDVPFINPAGFLAAATAPVRRTLAWLFR